MNSIMFNHHLNQSWSHLPLKKRVVKEITYEFNKEDPFICNYFSSYFYSNDEIFTPMAKKKCTKSITSINSEYSIDSGFAESPLDLSSPCSARNSSPQVFKYDPEVISGEFLFEILLIMMCFKKNCIQEF